MNPYDQPGQPPSYNADTDSGTSDEPPETPHEETLADHNGDDSATESDFPDLMTALDSSPSEDYISDTDTPSILTSEDADTYDHSHPAEIDLTINNVEATFRSPRSVDRTAPIDTPQLNTETAVKHPRGDVQLTHVAVLAAPLAASSNINNPPRWHTLLDRILKEWLDEGNLPPSRNPWGDDR